MKRQKSTTFPKISSNINALMIKAIGKLRRIVNILVNVEVLQIACVIQNKKV